MGVNEVNHLSTGSSALDDLSWLGTWAICHKWENASKFSEIAHHFVQALPLLTLTTIIREDKYAQRMHSYCKTALYSRKRNPFCSVIRPIDRGGSIMCNRWPGASSWPALWLHVFLDSRGAAAARQCLSSSPFCQYRQPKLNKDVYWQPNERMGPGDLTLMNGPPRCFQ